MTPSHLPMPAEPETARAETRALLEDSPEQGRRVIHDARFVADLLWQEWAERLEVVGIDHERFLTIARGYAGELRLWVVGERPWEHCVAGLAGRVTRRAPKRCAEAPALSEVG